jgi:hypothetical protein
MILYLYDESMGAFKKQGENGFRELFLCDCALGSASNE